MDINEALNCDPDEFMRRMLADKRRTVLFKSEDVAKALVAYGEVEAAERMSKLSQGVLREIGYRAHEIWSDFSGDRGPMLDTALCLAAVEKIEGKPRPLRRKRRSYAPKKRNISG